MPAPYLAGRDPTPGRWFPGRVPRASRGRRRPGRVDRVLLRPRPRGAPFPGVGSTPGSPGPSIWRLCRLAPVWAPCPAPPARRRREVVGGRPGASFPRVPAPQLLRPFDAPVRGAVPTPGACRGLVGARPGCCQRLCEENCIRGVIHLTPVGDQISPEEEDTWPWARSQPRSRGRQSELGLCMLG